jgi:Heterokaryon incompatibility protein (HET)
LTDLKNSQQVKLIQSSTLQKAIQYATLSHCWGPPDKSPLKTIKFNHEEHSKGIVLADLTPNFHDAVLICSKLGLDYIWIDSLCIIQDDAADWQVEAANMADIYRGSYLNIAATAARDAHGGIIGLSHLRDAQGRLTTIRYIDPHSKTTPEKTFVIQTDVGEEEYNVLSAHNYAYLTRGWVLQEQALSPRTVLFPKGQMFWQCRKCFTSEDGTMFSDGFWSLANGFQRGSSFDFSSLDDARETWHMWITSYSGRQLTYNTDVSAAVAGLLSFFGRKTGNSPMLGLWKQTFAFDLAWTIDYGSEVKAPSQTRPESDFPSWSWLSVLHQPKFPVEYNPPMLSKENLVSLRIESWEEKWSGAAYTSKLQSSRLVISSFARDATIHIPADGRWRGILFSMTISGTPSWKAHCKIQYLFPAGSKLAVKVVQLYQDIYPSKSVGDTFLVLLRTRDEKAHVYYRIGGGEVISRLPHGWVRGKHCEVHFKESDRETIELE